jgi:hypothetical protein
MIEGIFIPRIQATRGEVWIPSLSVLVARMKHPVLLRRPEGTDPELGLFDLQAAVSYFNLALWEDEDWEKDITLWVGKKPLRVERLATSNVAASTEALRIEGVNATWLPRE